MHGPLHIGPMVQKLWGKTSKPSFLEVAQWMQYYIYFHGITSTYCSALPIKLIAQYNELVQWIHKPLPSSMCKICCLLILHYTAHRCFICTKWTTQPQLMFEAVPEIVKQIGGSPQSFTMIQPTQYCMGVHHWHMSKTMTCLFLLR